MQGLVVTECLLNQALYKKILVSGKNYLYILENTNCTNNTNKGRVSQSLRGVTLLIAYKLHEYHPDGIRVIRL